MAHSMPTSSGKPSRRMRNSLAPCRPRSSTSFGSSPHGSGLGATARRICASGVRDRPGRSHLETTEGESPVERKDLVRRSYRAYETGDRQMLEEILAGDFRFWSPPDPGID